MEMPEAKKDDEEKSDGQGAIDEEQKKEEDDRQDQEQKKEEDDRQDQEEYTSNDRWNPQEMSVEMKKGQPVVYIEFCTNCSSHNWNNRHEESKYEMMA